MRNQSSRAEKDLPSSPDDGAMLILLICTECNCDIEDSIFLAEAEKRGVGPRSVGMIFSIYAFVNFCVSPYMGKALQRGYAHLHPLFQTFRSFDCMLPQLLACPAYSGTSPAGVCCSVDTAGRDLLHAMHTIRV